MTIGSSRATFTLPIAGETVITNGTVTFENVDDISFRTLVIVKVGAVEEKKPLLSLSPTEEGQLKKSLARLGFDYRAFLTSGEPGEGSLLKEVAARMGTETADTPEGQKRLERIFYGSEKDFGEGERWSLELMAAKSRLGESLDALKALVKVKPSETANAIKHLAEAATYPEEVKSEDGDYLVKRPRDFTDPLMTSACSYLKSGVFFMPMSAYETAMKAFPLVCPADEVYKIVTYRLPGSCRNGKLSHLVPNTAEPFYPDPDRERYLDAYPQPLAELSKKPERPEVTEARNVQECEKPWLRRIAVRSLGVILKRPAETEPRHSRDTPQDEVHEIRRRVAEDASARSQTTTKLVESLLYDPDSSVRMAAAYALSGAGSYDLYIFARENPYQFAAVSRLSQSVDGLQKKLSDLPERIRLKAVQPNGVTKQETQDPSAWKAYPTVKEMEEEKDPHRLAALVQRFGEGILLLNGRSHVPVIVAFLNNPSAEVSLAAAHVLAHLPGDFWEDFGLLHPDSVIAIKKTEEALSDFAHNCRVISAAMANPQRRPRP